MNGQLGLWTSIKSGFGAAGSLIQALEPPKADSNVKDESASPLSGPSAPSQEWSASASPNTVKNSGGEGQSEPDPTPVAIEREGSTGSVNVTVTSTDTVSIQPEPTLYGPYSGKRYIDVPGWVSREDWLAGGGTEYDYDWRYGQDYLPF